MNNCKLMKCCSPIIPTIFNESMSYYEDVCKLAYHLNEYESTNNEIIENLQTIIGLKYPTYVLVEAYGAIGDGKTDSTKAIQKCIDENPNSVIIFKKGNYLISDTITVKGNQGGQLILFGGAMITWNGILYDGYMIDVNAVSNYESRADLVGGTFNCNGKINGGVRLNMYHSTIKDCKIYDFLKEGLAIGHKNGGRSLQCVAENLYIFVSRTGGLPFTEENDYTAVKIYESDNMFSHINCLRCFTAVEIIAQGNEFTNCHFTGGFKTPQDDLPMSRAIYINPNSTTSINCNTFSNIYFDSFRIMVQTNGSNRCSTEISCSKFFGQYELSAVGLTKLFYSYMLYGGFHAVKVTNFEFIPVKSMVNLLDLQFSVSSGQFISKCNNNNSHVPETVYALTNRDIVSQLFWTESERNVVVSYNLNYGDGNYRKIASFLALTHISLSEIEITIQSLAYLYGTITIRPHITDSGYYISSVIKYGIPEYYLIITKEYTFENRTRIDIYLKCATSTVQCISMSAKFPSVVSAYLNYSAQSLATEESLNVEAKINLFNQ